MLKLESEALFIDRKEIFINANNLKTEDALIQRGESEIEEKEITIELEYLPGGPAEYLQDFDIGDVVYIIEEGLVEAKMRLIEVKEETEGSDTTLKLVLGREWPDLINIISRNKGEKAIIRR